MNETPGRNEVEAPQMVNTQLFSTQRGALAPAANGRNHHGANAYALSPRHQLAQLAATGTLSQTFYAGADDQLDAVLALAREVAPAFVAKAALYARQAGFMKDMPALLLATLAVRDVALLSQVFDRVVDNGKMLRNFVQILRSGVVGRKSLGTRPKKLAQAWLLRATEQQLLNAAVGTTPSLADVVKMVHPKPTEAWRAAWFAWLIGKPFEEAALPPATQAFERFKRGLADGKLWTVPEVPFQMLAGLDLTPNQREQVDTHVALNGSWQMVRQNLNAFQRHGVFRKAKVVQAVAAKLRDPQAVARSRVLPYQLLSAYTMTATTGVPDELRDALQDAMEAALANVPALAGAVVVCPDVSGSMSAAVTGERGGATSSVRCIDVAALMAAAVLRKNPQARVLPFEQHVVSALKLNPRDSVMTNAAKLADVGGGGTNCSAPLALLNREKASADLVMLVSDNESWVDDRRHGATQTLREWGVFKQRNPHAKLVCIDVQPYATTQALERADILNVGGFSDQVFKLVAAFAAGTLNAGHWVGVIEDMTLQAS
jgi:60 kDa SS-A/Ro ribonucleoprotein